MEKSMISYLKEAIAAFDRDKTSQEKYLAVFFALIDVGMAEEEVELLMQTGRGDSGNVNSAPYCGVTRSGEKIWYVFADTEGRDFSDGLFTKKITLRLLCNRVAEEGEISAVVFSLAEGGFATFSRDDVALLLQHLNSPVAPQER